VRLYYEWGTRQLNKCGEELCGDTILVSRLPDSVTLALADGLGSGVKASILSTLTARIAVHLLENDLPLGEVVDTLSNTLPVCQIRKLAYSTFVIAQFFSNGHARIVEFDTPPAVLLRNRTRFDGIAVGERVLGGKRIRESGFSLQLGDWVIFVSDGVINAGIGGLYPLGWGMDQATRFMEQHAHPGVTAQELADRLAEAVGDLYADQPGDDVSVVVFKVRHRSVATVLVGPPAKREDDESVARRFLQRHGLHIVCGGTTGKIVARHLGQPLAVDLSTLRPDVPPIARMPGVDLMTEGVLTLTKVTEMLRNGVRRETLKFKTDGASSLLRLLLDTDHVHFITGTAANPAHQNPDLPLQLSLKLSEVKAMAEELRKRNIEVTIEPAQNADRTGKDGP